MSEKIQNANVKLNSKELKEFLTHIVKNNEYIQAKGKTPIAVSVTGEAGTGKTSSIIELADELNLQLVKINLAQVEEIGDIVGFPIKEFQITNAEGKTTWIVEQQIDAAIKKGYKIIGKRMAYAAPEWIQGKGEGGILLIDDFNRADSRFSQACMELK
jgi:MoxR-like ATPase